MARGPTMRLHTWNVMGGHPPPTHTPHQLSLVRCWGTLAKGHHHQVAKAGESCEATFQVSLVSCWGPLAKTLVRCWGPLARAPIMMLQELGNSGSPPPPPSPAPSAEPCEVLVSLWKAAAP